MNQAKTTDSNPDIALTLKKQREFFASGKTRDIKFRKEQLKKLRKAIMDHEQDIYTALYGDFRKPVFETFMSEIGTVLNEISDSIKNVKKWSKTKTGRTPLTHLPARSRMYYDPYGVVLIIAPWNYPFNLLMAPLVGAIVAGNCAIVKTAPASANTSSVIKKILTEIYPEEYVAVFEGDRHVNNELLEKEYDYIFFTGGPIVGRAVLEAAAKYLTPVTLELGGKSPCIVADDADITLAARRIVWGKFFNCGQTCVAPDYLMVSDKIKIKLFEAMKKEIKNFYGDDPKKSPDFPRIITDHHFKRVSALLKNGRIVTGGNTDPSQRYIAPTIIDNITWDDPVMKEEIFGPVLPTITIKSIDHAIDMIRNRPKPLALYIFTKSRKTKLKVLTETSSGGGCVNDTLMHFANGYVPFGGVGMSGMGSYHGEASFRTFSHQKSIIEKSLFLDNPFRYAPYGKLGLRIIKTFMG